jgi:cellulose synthase/poly-beta-1,6-N-acetylglucosamine synthase-like glycosyltransferase
MATFISCLIIGLAILVSIPTVVVLVEVVAAILLPTRARAPQIHGRPRTAVIVPAHNESAWLLPTLNDVKADLILDDRLVVVADNCTDDTAAVAAAAGAEVVVRNDPQRIGKGYALDWGLRYLCADPPEVLIIIDADCRISCGAIGLLAMTCATTGRPAQALYLVTAPEGTTINYRVAEFASRVKNWVRPMGLNALNLPCQLMGTGMAFPFDVIRSAELATGQIVEDFKLGLDLAHVGKSADFCPYAIVTSCFPASLSAAKSQRQRWEHGHIDIILGMLPRFLCRAIVSRNWSLLALALDGAVPPLTLLGVLVFTTIVIATLGTLFGFSTTALIISSSSLAAFVLAIALAWWQYGHDLLPPRKIGSVVSFVIGKFPLYRRFLTHGPDSEWIRTEREKAGTKIRNNPLNGPSASATTSSSRNARGRRPIVTNKR